MNHIAPADLATVTVPVGGRVLVVSDLHLSGETTPGEDAVARELVQAVEGRTGPGVVIFNGNLFDAGVDVPGAVKAHPEMAAAVRRYSEGPGRRVLVLPGDRDANLAWSGWAPLELATELGAELALAAELVIDTGVGIRRVRVEPGRQLDPLATVRDPWNPGESPLSQHLRLEVLPSVQERERPRAGRRPGWLAGLEELDDPSAFPRFIASRLAYRKLGRQAWLLLIPVAVAIAFRLPALALVHARTVTDVHARVGLLALTTVVELVLLAAVAGATIRSTARALGGLSLGGDRADPNEEARASARTLVTDGFTGLVTGHTCRPELTYLGTGFYANCGAAAEVVSETPARLSGLGLPPVFLAHRQVTWLELEAGGELHVRLLHARQDVRGATVLERLVVHRPENAVETRALRPEVVATFPQGTSWPAATGDETRRRRVRRVASLVVSLAGLVSLVAALVDPVRDRLRALRAVVPIAVPETASALTAFGAIGLLIVARGIRRGQRRAWLVTETLLVAVAILHLVRGIAVEEALIALTVALFLWLARDSFRAGAEGVKLRGGIPFVLGLGVLTVCAGALGLELTTWAHQRRFLRRYPRLSWARAFEASVERMIGDNHVPLPPRVDDFFSPAMGAATGALTLALLVLLLRPVVQRGIHRAGTGSPGTRPVANWHLGRGPILAVNGVEPDKELAMSRARGIFARHGSGTLDYFALRPDKELFFWGDTMVAHAVYGGVCLVSPDPIGPVAEREPAWRAFRDYVDRQGWALGGLGAGEEWLPIYRATGMHDLYVGDEAIVRTQRFTLQGGRFKGLRQAVNRVAKYGYTITFHDPATIGADLRHDLENVMTKSRRGDVERGFSMTLGRVFDRRDEGLLLAVVHGPADASGTPGVPVAFCHYVPAPGIGGYSLDLMRRDDGEHPNGLIDFAVVETISYLRDRGGDGLGLNFATIRAVLAGEAGDGLSQRIQGWLLRRMGDSMQIESLWKFNAKFDPEWQPRYAVYDAPENALGTAIAMARAESFWELPVIGRFLVPSTERLEAVAGTRE